VEFSALPSGFGVLDRKLLGRARTEGSSGRVEGKALQKKFIFLRTNVKYFRKIGVVQWLCNNELMRLETDLRSQGQLNLVAKFIKNCRIPTKHTTLSFPVAQVFYDESWPGGQGRSENGMCKDVGYLFKTIRAIVIQYAPIIWRSDLSHAAI
jgi:hypothetical protein